jgi:hypothetical protein
VAWEVARLSAALEQARRWAQPEALVEQAGAAARDAAVRPREAVGAAVPQPAVRRAAVQAGKAELPPEAVRGGAVQAGKAELPPEAVRGGAPVRPMGVAAQAAEEAAGRGAVRDEVAPRRAAVRDGVAALPAARAAAGVRRRVAPDAREVLHPALVWAVHRGRFLLCPAR